MTVDERCRVSAGGADLERTRQLRFAVALTSVVFVGELIGGLWTGSLALLSDAAHVFSDVFALALSLFAVVLACRPPTTRHTYGLHRTEVFAAFINGVSLLVISGLILHEAYQRLHEPPDIKAVEMLVIAAVGLVANWVVATRLKGHSHGDLNLRSAYLHVLGDLLASAAVVVGAVIIALTGQALVDPALSVGIALIILVGGVRVIGESSHILLEGVPRGLDLTEVADAMTALPQVESVHSLHAWSICSNIQAFSAHVVTCPESERERAGTRQRLEEILMCRFGFAHTTLELECEPCAVGAGLLRHMTHEAPPDDGHYHHHTPGHVHDEGEPSHGE